ncbi:MAG: glutaredoxin family protein [Gammaproteobacteria bacterium]|nr:glutaredoxin family protein [Gammaproteobacteria bacterium]
MRYSIFGILAVITFLAVPAYGEIYQWKDADGNVQFGDRPPPSKKVKRIELEINSYESVTVEPFVAYKSNRPSRGKSVVMYSTSWCGYCRKARNYMKSKRIPFQEYDIEKSEKARREYNKLNGRGVPVLLIGDKRMNGFSISRFRQLYGG